MKRKDAVDVATVVASDGDRRGQLIGCSIPLPLGGGRILLKDVYDIAETMQRAGSDGVTLNSDGGTFGRISAIGQSWHGILPSAWSIRMPATLESMRMLRRVKTTISDSHSQRELKIRA